MYIWPLVLKRDLSSPWAISDILQWNNKKDVKRFYIYRMLPGAYKTRAVVVVSWAAFFFSFFFLQESENKSPHLGKKMTNTTLSRQCLSSGQWSFSSKFG